MKTFCIIFGFCIALAVMLFSREFYNKHMQRYVTTGKDNKIQKQFSVSTDTSIKNLPINNTGFFDITSSQMVKILKDALENDSLFSIKLLSTVKFGNSSIVSFEQIANAGSLINEERNRFEGASYDRMKLNNGFIRKLVDFPVNDTFCQYLERIKNIDRYGMAAHELILRLFQSYKYLQKNPRFYRMLNRELEQRIKKGISLNEDDSYYFPEYLNAINPQYSKYFLENERMLFFWIERKQDSTFALIKSILSTITRNCHLQESINIFESDIGENNMAEIKKDSLIPVFFSNKSFCNVNEFNDMSYMDCKEKMIDQYFLLADSVLHYNDHGVKKLRVDDPLLWNRLVGFNSKYFDTNLVYFALVSDSVKKNCYWKHIQLVPSLIIGCTTHKHGPSLDIELTFSTENKNDSVLFFSGIPYEQYKRGSLPSGYYECKEISRVDTIYESSEWGWVTIRTVRYSVSEQEKRISALICEEKYAGNAYVDSVKDTIPLRVSAVLKACMKSGKEETILIDTIQTREADGKAFIGKPVISDIDGDGIADIVVRVRRGFVGIIWEEDGGHREVGF